MVQGNGPDLQPVARHGSVVSSSTCRCLGCPLALCATVDNVISNSPDVKGRDNGPLEAIAWRRSTRRESRLSLKLAVVGGGSTYTPELIDGLARRVDRLPVDDLVLLDIDPERLDIVGGLARRMLAKLGWGGRLTVTADTDAAIEGADFVLIQLRVGGQAARLVDETLPPRFGTIGQETTGAGGFAKALRTVPVVLDLAELVGRRAAPGVDRRLREPGRDRDPGAPRRGPPGDRAVQRRDRLPAALRGALRRGAGAGRARARRAQPPVVDPRGQVDGVERLPEILETEAAALADDIGTPPEIVRLTRSIPSYYLKYYYAFDKVLESQRDEAESRASEVMDIEFELLSMYRNPNLDEKPKLLEQRGGRSTRRPRS